MPVQRGPALTRKLLRRRFSVDDYGAIGNGVADDRLAIARAVADINNEGGGTLVYNPSKEYRCYTGSYIGNVATFVNCRAVRVEGWGATLTVDKTRDPSLEVQKSLGQWHSFDSCSNVALGGFRTDAFTPDVTTTTVMGVEFAHFYNCKNVWMPNNRVTNFLAGAVFDNADGAGVYLGEATTCENVNIGNLYVENAWYGVLCKFGVHHMDIRNLMTFTIHRSLYLFGTRNVRANVCSKNYKATDIMLQTLQGVPTDGLWLNYRNRDESTANGSAHISLSHYFGVQGTFRDIHLNVRKKYNGTAGSGGTLIQHVKYDANLDFDLIDRGHVVDGLHISGNIEGSPHPSVGNGGVIATDPNCNFGPGDNFYNWSIDKLRINASDAFGQVNLRLAALKDQISIRRTVSNQGIFLVESAADPGPPHLGKVIVGDDVQCLNRNTDTTGISQSIGSIRAASNPQTIYPAWSGRRITNRGQVTDYTALLPAAVPGLRFPFTKMTAGRFHLKPQVGETIQGGTVSFRMFTDTLGDSGEIECFTAGTWSITARYGTWGFTA